MRWWWPAWVSRTLGLQSSEARLSPMKQLTELSSRRWLFLAAARTVSGTRSSVDRRSQYRFPRYSLYGWTTSTLKLSVFSSDTDERKASSCRLVGRRSIPTLLLHRTSAGWRNTSVSRWSILSSFNPRIVVQTHSSSLWGRGGGGNQGKMIALKSAICFTYSVLLLSILRALRRREVVLC